MGLVEIRVGEGAPRDTKLGFHRRCFRHPAFIEGDYGTGFIGRNAKELAPTAELAELEAAIIAASLDAITASTPAATASGTSSTTEMSAWRRQVR